MASIQFGAGIVGAAEVGRQVRRLGKGMGIASRVTPAVDSKALIAKRWWQSDVGRLLFVSKRMWRPGRGIRGIQGG